jgi:glycosyltransferase involved in cell wall biosynthesis
VKIAHALGWYFPESLGGTEIYVAGLCRRLRLAGHDVYVAAPEAGRKSAAEYCHEAVPVFRYPVPAKPWRDEVQGRRAARGAEFFHRWLAERRPDILHIHSLVTGLGLHELQIAGRLGIRIVLTHHLPSFGYICRRGTLLERDARPCDGIASPPRCAACMLVSRGLSEIAAATLARVPPQVSELLGVIPGRLGTALGMSGSIARDRIRARQLSALVDRQVVLNETARRIIAANGLPTERVELNRLGTDHGSEGRKPSIDAAPTRQPVRIGYLGRIDRTKGLRELVRAATSVPRAIGFTLEVRGPVRTEIERGFHAELQQIANGDPRVSFKPEVTAGEVPGILAAFDVLCCPSIWFENGPTVALEALRVGTPLIASRLGNLAEIVADDVNGRLVTAGDVEALSTVLRQVAEDPAGTIDRWRGGLGPIRSLDAVADDYLAIYDRLAPGRAQAS